VKLSKYLIAAVLLIWACDEDDKSVAPRPCTDISICDTCNNGGPRDPVDSSLNLPPSPRYIISYVQRGTSDYIFVGCCELEGWNGIYQQYNNFVYDSKTQEIRIIPGSSWLDLSPDRKKILSRYGYYDFVIIDAETYEYTTLRRESSGNPHWSIDGQSIYYQQGGKVWSTRIIDLATTSYDANLNSPQQFNDTVIVGYKNDTLYYYNINSNTLSSCGFNIPSENQTFGVGYNSIELSPDRKYALGQVVPLHVSDNDTNQYNSGLYLFDFAQKKTRRILKSQHWSNPYYQKWTNRDTFFASYYCRKDSAAMVYEFDLNGKTIRQVTFKEQKYYP